jgi:hypothetical protein
MIRPSTSGVRVTVTTEVLDERGDVQTTITRTARASGGNPAFTSRVLLTASPSSAPTRRAS